MIASLITRRPTPEKKNGHLTGTAVITMVARASGVKVVPFKLFKSLRVSSVAGPSGEQLNFIQEAKTDDPQFWVVLSKPMAKEERCEITVHYAGNEAIEAEIRLFCGPVAQLVDQRTFNEFASLPRDAGYCQLLPNTNV